MDDQRTMAFAYPPHFPHTTGRRFFFRSFYFCCRVFLFSSPTNLKKKKKHFFCSRSGSSPAAVLVLLPDLFSFCKFLRCILFLTIFGSSFSFCCIAFRCDAVFMTKNAVTHVEHSAAAAAAATRVPFTWPMHNYTGRANNSNYHGKKSTSKIKINPQLVWQNPQNETRRQKSNPLRSGIPMGPGKTRSNPCSTTETRLINFNTLKLVTKTQLGLVETR